MSRLFVVEGSTGFSDGSTPSDTADSALFQWICPMTLRAPHYLLFSQTRQQSQHEECDDAWRFVIESVDGSEKIEASDAEPEAEGDRLELLAVVRGLESLDQPSRITLVTASRYVSRGMRYGLSQWRESEWRWEKFGRMVPVRNNDLWKRIDSALRIHRVDCRQWRFDAPHQPQNGQPIGESPRGEKHQTRRRFPALLRRVFQHGVSKVA